MSADAGRNGMTETLYAPVPANPTILAVVVLYRMLAESSPAFTSLREIQRHGDAARSAVELMVCDNTPAQQTTPRGFVGEYVRFPDNPGLGRCYNTALEAARERGIPWLLLLDQDTTLTAEFVTELIAAASQYAAQMQVAAMVPKLVRGSVVLSPHHPPFLGPAIPIKAGFEGIWPGRLHVFNSGSTLRVDAVTAMGGFPAGYTLEFLDHATFSALQAQGGRIAVLRSVLQHDLSVYDPGHAAPELVPRQISILDAQFRFYKQFGSPTERLFLRLRLVRTALGRIYSRQNWDQTARLLRSAFPCMSCTAVGPEIEVLLATYNGARFLREQLDSILEQTYKPLRVTASDDGSQDESVAILAEYAARHPARVRLLPYLQPQGSAPANFLQLMHAATADSVCFADQDDVWLPGKVARSMRAMVQLEERYGAATPLLVFTDLRVVDRDLKPLAASMWQHMKLRPGSAQRLERLLGQTVVTGCTMLLNRPLLQLAQRMPPAATMHDRWIALLAACMGHTACVDEPTVLYRQHDRNVVGAVAQDGSAAAVAGRIADSSGRCAERLRSEAQAEALLRIHGQEMPVAVRMKLEAYLESGRSPNALRRLWLTLRNGFFRGTPPQTAALLADLARHRSPR